MNAAMSYGGWVPDRHATGETSSFVRLVGWVAAAGAALTVIGTGGELPLKDLQRSTQKALHTVPTIEVVQDELVRTPSENLTRIREVLNPAVSELATTFGVTRQSVYNWLNGAPVADENSVKLQDLAQAADILAHEGVTVNTALLKRKFANGRTLMQVAQAGGSTREAALLLVQINKRETAQRERMKARFANRARTPASADFDLPASNDRV